MNSKSRASSIVIGNRSSGARARAFAVAALALALASGACGGDSEEDLIGDNMAPTVEVAFPPPVSLTDADTITIRGRAADPDGIAAVRVNGELATTSDQFAEWEATVSLTHGQNAVVIATEDELGFVEEQAASLDVILSANFLRVPTAVVSDPANERALALDRVLDAVLSIDYATGERVIVSAEGVGAGPRLQDPRAIALDPPRGRALVLETATARLLAIDLASGDRTVIADATTGGGTALEEPSALAVDAAGGQAWVLDLDLTDPLDPEPILVAIDLVSGDRAVLADAGGIRPVLTDPTALAVDPATQQLYVADLDVTDPVNPVISIFQIDAVTAARVLLSGLDPIALAEPTALAYDANIDENLLFVLDASLDAVVSVDLATGARAIVSEDGESPGQEFSVPVSLALDRVDAGTTRALVIDTGIDELLAVDLATGARTVLTEIAVGAGPFLARPVSVALDLPSGVSGRAFVIDETEDALLSVNLATGERTVVSGDDVGSGPPLDRAVAVALDVPASVFGQEPPARRAFVIDGGAEAIVRVDLATGARSELSGPQAGSGPALVAPSGLAFLAGDPALGTADRLIVSAGSPEGALVEVDVTTGARSILTDADPGNGPVLSTPGPVTAELGELGPTGRVLTADADLAALIAVGLDAGDREALSGQGVGDGAAITDPRGVIVELARIPPDPDAEEPGPDDPPLPLYAPTGFALVLHGGPASLMAIELSTGRRTELTGVESGRGPAFDAPSAMAHDPDNERLIVLDTGSNAVLVIDLRTDQHVMVSR